MALTLAEARPFLAALFLEFGEDYQSQARILRVLRAMWPSFDWPTELRTRARAHAAFATSGLSVDWWVDEIVRLSS